MKINKSKILELIQSVTKQDEIGLLKLSSYSEATKWLARKGFKELGYGEYAVVYTRPGAKKVVKVSYRSDKCWIGFARYSLSKHISNSHLPKIDWIQYADNKKFFITVIERLYKVDYTKLTNKDDLLGLYHFTDIFEFDESEILDKYLSETKNWKPKTKFSKLLEQFSRRDPSPGCEFDLHEDNIMQRKNGTLVIIDPYSSD